MNNKLKLQIMNTKIDNRLNELRAMNKESMLFAKEQYELLLLEAIHGHYDDNDDFQNLKRALREVTQIIDDVQYANYYES